MAEPINDDVQHGIDDNPHDDGKKGLELGALGGGTVGAIAGMAAGPIGAIVGAIVGGTAGSIASGAAVDAVDSVDNDNTVTGIGGGETHKSHAGHATDSVLLDAPGNNVPGVQTGGVTTAGADSRGIMEKTADVVTGDNRDDKTGGLVTDSMVNAGGLNIGATGYSDETTRASGDNTIRVPVVEEELHVDKTMQQAGEVSIHKEVVEEQVNVPVTLQHEEVVITRHAVNRDLAPGESASGLEDDEVIRVPVMEEQAQVSKTARVVEEVEIDKRLVSEQQTVTDTVRREEVEIDDPTARNR